VRVAAPLGAVGHGAGALRTRVGGLSATSKRRLLMLLAVLALLATVYLAWFRDSSFVAVEDVSVTGLTTEDAPKIRARLIAAARDMTTLHVDEEALMRALPAGAAVADLRVTTDFPHGLRITVVQSPAVAVLAMPGRRVAVAADGSLLKGVRGGNVPTIDVGALPNSGRLGRGRAKELVAVAVAAPPALRRRIGKVRKVPGKGLVAYVESGPQLIFGDSSSLAAKWAAAAAVLADGESRGASYVDVSIPGRPVAGGLSVPQPEAEQPPAGAGAAPGTTPAVPGTTPGAAGTPGAVTPGTPVAPVQPGAAAPDPGAAPAQPAPAYPAPGTTP
jgi:cell division protein FtsQ